jgi:hypothetical protein
MKLSIPTDVLAWWGASVSTVVFLWDIHKWRSTGPRLRFEVWCDQILVPSADKRIFIRFEVTNTGDRSTTLQNLGLLHFANSRWSWKALRKMPRTRGHIRNLPWILAARAVVNSSLFIPLQASTDMPVKLAPGDTWVAMVEQTQFESNFSKGLLYFTLHHSHTQSQYGSGQLSVPARISFRHRLRHNIPSRNHQKLK